MTFCQLEIIRSTCGYHCRIQHRAFFLDGRFPFSDNSCGPGFISPVRPHPHHEKISSSFKNPPRHHNPILLLSYQGDRKCFSFHLGNFPSCNSPTPLSCQWCARANATRLQQLQVLSEIRHCRLIIVMKGNLCVISHIVFGHLGIQVRTMCNTLNKRIRHCIALHIN